MIKSGTSFIKNKATNIGSSIKSGVKQAGKWAWDHREGIGKVIGAGLDAASMLGVPGANIASKVVKGIANVSKAAGDDKFSKGLQATMKKKDKGNDNTNNTNSNTNTNTGGYSLNVRGSGGTKEGRRFYYETLR